MTDDSPIAPPTLVSCVRNDSDQVVMTFDRPLLDDELAALANTPSVLSAMADEMTLAQDRAMRMELALRIIRIYAMGPTLLQDSGLVRDWMKDWIDGFDNGVVRHGPLGGPMVWPVSASLQQQLILWGFSRTEGEIGYVFIPREAPADPEQVN